jgi:hypothetical protein
VWAVSTALSEVRVRAFVGVGDASVATNTRASTDGIVR